MEKWSFSKIDATKGCRIAFEKKYIQNAPPDTEVPEFVEAHKIHENIQQDFLKKQIEYPALTPYLNNSIFVEKKYSHYFQQEDIEFIAFADVVMETEVSRVIIDIKCRYNSGINERDKLQLLVYSALANEERPTAQTKIGILAPYNLYSPISLVEINPPSVDFILSEIEKAKRRIQRMQIKTSECEYCEYRKGCEYGKTETDETDLQAVAEKYLYLKAQIERYEEMLRKHAEITGKKIKVGDKELGFFERFYTKVNVSEFLTLCKDNKIPFLNSIKIDTAKAKYLAKKYDILTSAMEKEIKYVFGTKKIEEKEE